MLYLIPPVIGLLLLAAHFFRSENLLVALVCFLAIFLAFVRRPWAAYTMQICLVLGAAEWLRSTIFLIQYRSASGQPFLRLAIILGSVTAFTALASLILRNRTLRDHFRIEPGQSSKEQP